MADAWWHIAQTPTGVRVTEIGEGDDRDTVVLAVCASLDFPADWVDVSGWDSSLSLGEPHEDLMRRAEDTLGVYRAAAPGGQDD